jgi:HD-GYP domain-containing protein (c-di-GMP phosphodiesterase class II)
MADSIDGLLTEQEEACFQMLKSLTKALQSKDAYTAAHSGRVAHYSRILGENIGLDEETLNVLSRGALVHDLGKIGVPELTLNKPSKLTDEEYATIKKHPVDSAIIMRPLVRLKAYSEIAAWHHEHWDGSGYPDGLAGEEIPLLARIVSIADSWDAMTGARVYHDGMPIEQGLEILEREKDNGQWDPQLVRAFIEAIRDNLDSEPKPEPEA